MARVAYSALCRRVITDQATNAVSLIDILESIEVTPPPEVPRPPRMKWGMPFDGFFVTTWTRDRPEDPEQGPRVRLAILGPNQKVLAKSIEQVALLDRFENYRVVSHIPLLPVIGPGVYEFAVQSSTDGNKWRTVYKLPLAIKFKIAPEKASDPAPATAITS